MRRDNKLKTVIEKYEISKIKSVLTSKYMAIGMTREATKMSAIASETIK
jgi:hypothetical protein